MTASYPSAFTPSRTTTLPSWSSVGSVPDRDDEPARGRGNALACYHAAAWMTDQRWNQVDSDPRFGSAS